MTIQTKALLDDMPFFKNNEDKENFLNVIGALSIKIISLKKGAELLNIDISSLLKLLDTVGFDYSFLAEDDIEVEKKDII